MNDNTEGQRAQIESLSRRYQPVGPPAPLRDRVLTMSQSRQNAVGVWAALRWASIAAMLLLTIILNHAVNSIHAETASLLTRNKVRWTAQAEELVQILDGDGAGRTCLAMHLSVGEPVVRPASMNEFISSLGDMP